MHDESTLVRPSRRMLSFFANYLNWYIGRHFHAVRLANSPRFPRVAGPLIVYANHASWWDPLAFIVISRYFLPTASHYAPMDAAALKHYALLRKLGIFPVEAGTRRGAAQFLRAANEILSTPNSVLWIPRRPFHRHAHPACDFPSGVGRIGGKGRRMHSCAPGL
jgi:1-acyl-sn-glycerol-3-phosphate acyltransferase